MQDHDESPTEPALQLPDLVNAHDARAMDANEFLRVEALFQGIQMLAAQMGFASRVKADISSVPLEPGYALDGDDDNPLLDLDGKPGQIPVPARDFPQQLDQLAS